MKRFSYLLTLFCVFCVPAIVAGSYLSSHISLESLVPFVITITIIGSVWDVWATRHGKRDRVWLWQFNHRQTIGVRLLGLPIEEYLFYVASSVYVIFMWESFKLMINNAPSEVYIVTGLLSLWTLFAISLPFWLGRKTDKFIG